MCIRTLKLSLRLLIASFFLVSITACNMLQPKLVQPKVELASVHLGKNLGLRQMIDLELLITNNNDRDLSMRSLRYEIGIDDLALFSGDAYDLPLLKAHEATPVHLELSTDLISVFKLIERFSHNQIGDKVTYQLTADLDFSAWLPTLHVNKKGTIPLRK